MPLATNSSRAISSNARLKPAKVLSEEIINFSKTPDTIVLRLEREFLANRAGILAGTNQRQSSLIGVQNVADANRPQMGGAEVRLEPHPFVVFHHLPRCVGDLHFLLNACVPNQNAMTVAQICCVSSSQM